MRQRLTEHEQRILAEIEHSLSRDERLDRAMRMMTLPSTLPPARQRSPHWMRIAWWVAGFWMCLLLVGAARHVVVLMALGAVLGVVPAIVLGCLQAWNAVRRRKSRS